MAAPEDVEAGTVVRYERTFSREDVAAFADLSGDRGYHHLVDEREGPVMVHGLLTATMPTKVGGDIDYVARTMDFAFPRPVYTGEAITCEVTIESVTEREGRRDLDVAWDCTNEDGETVLTGTSSGVIFG